MYLQKINKTNLKILKGEKIMYHVVYESREGEEVRVSYERREDALNYYRSHIGDMVYGYIADDEAEESGIGQECMAEAAAEITSRAAAVYEDIIDWNAILG